jgi:hypothetical protein
MSYDPSHRKPRHAGRMPQVITPEEAWPAVEGEAYADGGYRAGGQGAAEGQGVYWSAPSHQRQSYQQRYPGYDGHGVRGATSGWGGWATSDNGYRAGPDAYNGYGTGGGDGFDGPRDGFDGASDGFDGAWDGFDGSAGYHDYGDYADYAEPAPGDPALTVSDTDGWRAGRGEPGRRGLVVGAVTGFLAAGMAIGVATLAAAFVRPQASPIIAVGEAFIDRTPPALKNFAVQRFGENDKTMLLLGMYAGIAVLAMVIGCLARRNAAIGVGGIAAFGLFGAFVAISRPESHPTDVVPSVIGGLAGIVAYAWLAWAASPVAPTTLAPVRHARAGGHRRAW